MPYLVFFSVLICQLMVIDISRDQREGKRCGDSSGESLHLSMNLYPMILCTYITECGGTFLKQIDQEREGEQIDRALLKNVLDIFVEIGLGNMDCYENDFEDFLLKDTTDYYSVKAQSWIVEDSCPDYMIKVPSI